MSPVFRAVYFLWSDLRLRLQNHAARLFTAEEVQPEPRGTKEEGREVFFLPPTRLHPTGCLH